MPSLKKRLKSLELKITRFYRKKKAKVAHHAGVTPPPWSERKKYIITSGIREHCEINGSARLIFRQQRLPGDADKLMYVCRLEPESPQNGKTLGIHSTPTNLQSHMYKNSDYFMQTILSNCNQSADCRCQSHDGMFDYKKSGFQSNPSNIYGTNKIINNISHNNVCPVSLMQITESMNDGSFVKYIPVKEEYGWVYPRYLVDEQSPASWFDIQCWYQQYKLHKAFQPLQNSTDGAKSTSDVGTADASLSIYDDSMMNLDMWCTGDVVVEGKSYEITDDLADHPRFGLAANQDYLNLLVEQNSSNTWLCHMQFFFCDNSKRHLFQIKSELLVSCMQAFVQKDADFEVLWVDDIKKILPEKETIASFFGENEKLVSAIEQQITNAKAVLYVTEKASILLRHPDTCFLSSLARSAGLKRSELVVLPLDIKPEAEA
ncbi:uncharacterized protein LOC121372463 [Gigantopelta aegis]|uniref:uncharacterized protein LOC121372463 n=1 Tax=Gigantopelta aegis TaxID=1735272 RepID=UPI001B889F61|nr:uncharacterized protein LOC121372463 [Gigantopelta aegis]